MAVNLIDRTKLDACLDAEADAIRAKTGGSADIPFDFANNKGFADAIAAIPSGGGEITATLVGETPVMGSSMNQNLTNICTFDIDGISFDAILFISKDRAAFKLIPYFETTIAKTYSGFGIYGSYYSATSVTASFVIEARESVNEKTITVNHSRMTGTSGGFYSYNPQKFDIYAVVLNPSSWVQGVS